MWKCFKEGSDRSHIHLIHLLLRLTSHINILCVSTLRVTWVQYCWLNYKLYLAFTGFHWSRFDVKIQTRTAPCTGHHDTVYSDLRQFPVSFLVFHDLSFLYILLALKVVRDFDFSAHMAVYKQIWTTFLSLWELRNKFKTHIFIMCY